MAWAIDPQNENEVRETSEFLNATVVDKAAYISTFRSRNDSSFRWAA
jgi:hypothetical protein